MIVGYPKDVKEVVFGLEGKKGLLDGLNEGARNVSKVIVDMTTSEPSLAVELSQKADDKGIFFLDAPVSGGDIGARNATLSIMIGGEKEVKEKIDPLFACMGKNIRHLGPAGIYIPMDFGIRMSLKVLDNTRKCQIKLSLQAQ